MNTNPPVTFQASPGEPELDRWLVAIGQRGEPALIAEAHEIVIRIVRRIRYLRCATPGSSEWVEAELEVLRRRLAVLASPAVVREVIA